MKKVEKHQSMMPNLPEEIYIDILLRLPVKSTLICKSVCKNWYALISNPSFVKTHHNLTIQRSKFSIMVSNFSMGRFCQVIYSLSYDHPLSISSDEFHLYGLQVDIPLEWVDFNFEFMGCCDGLVCIWNAYREFFSLWNLDRNEYKHLPKSPNKPVDQDIFITCAFGYDCSTGDYKMICLYQKSRGVFLVDVYVMGLNSWKDIQEVRLEIDMDEEPGVHVNGVFHWLGYRIGMDEVIISLDISSETFKELQPPKEPGRRKSWSTVGVLNDCLCVLGSGFEFLEYQVWVMHEYGVQESWARHYIIRHERMDRKLRPMWSFNSGEILFARCGWRLKDLVLYDPKDGSIRKPNMHVENQCTVFGMTNVKCLNSLYFSTHVG